MGLCYGEPLPWYYWRVKFAELFGWTFEHIDGMDAMEVLRTIEVLNTQTRALNSIGKRGRGGAS